jgi:predicted ATPase with chaperone activity
MRDRLFRAIPTHGVFQQYRPKADIQQVSHLDTEMGLIRGRTPAPGRSIVRTLADLEGVDGINRLHIAEALPYRGQKPGRG